MELILQWTILILCILGVIKGAELFCLWFRRPGQPPKIHLVLPLQGHLEEPQAVLSYFEKTAMWCPEIREALVMDCGLDEESALECKKLCQDSRLTYFTQKDFQEICKARKDKVY